MAGCADVVKELPRMDGIGIIGASEDGDTNILVSAANERVGLIADLLKMDGFAVYPVKSYRDTSIM